MRFDARKLTISSLEENDDIFRVCSSSLLAGGLSQPPSRFQELPSSKTILSDSTSKPCRPRISSHFPQPECKTKCSDDSASMPHSATVRASSSCVPAKIRRCCTGGKPSRRQSNSLQLPMVSLPSTCKVRAFPVSILTYTWKPCSLQESLELAETPSSERVASFGKSWPSWVMLTKAEFAPILLASCSMTVETLSEAITSTRTEPTSSVKIASGGLALARSSCCRSSMASYSWIVRSSSFSWKQNGSCRELRLA
mmetsp:Transcript_50787/g.121395  ORF Transcript_50787/g.121395 Transcript_50787/m.121395 type:complete len:254 (-) Transcript_50787:47-808(-)